MLDLPPLARVLRSELERRGWTQRNLAAAAGLSQQLVSRYLTGQREPLLSSAVALADALGLSLDQLAGRKPIAARRR